jgi:hypothetical protein
LQLLFVCCVKTAKFNKPLTCTQQDGNNQIHDALKPFTSRPLVPPLSLTFLSRGKNKHPYPSHTVLIKARIGLGWVFLITCVFSIPKPIKNTSEDNATSLPR